MSLPRNPDARPKSPKDFFRAFPLILLFIGLALLAGCAAGSPYTETEGGRSSAQLEVVEQESFADGDEIRIEGIVRNNSKEVIDIAVISGSAYDDEGAVIGTETAEIEQIGIGEEVPFEITINPTVDDLQSIEWHCTAEVE